MTVNTSARKIAVVLSDFNYTRIFFSTEFRKEKNCNVKLNENPSGCFMRADKRTDRLAKNITVAFRNFAESAYESKSCSFTVGMISAPI